MQRKRLMLNMCFPSGSLGLPHMQAEDAYVTSLQSECGPLGGQWAFTWLALCLCCHNLLLEELNLSCVLPLLEICALVPPSSLLCVFSFCWICFVSLCYKKPSHEYNCIRYTVGSSQGSLKLGRFGGPPSIAILKSDVQNWVLAILINQSNKINKETRKQNYSSCGSLLIVLLISC